MTMNEDDMDDMSPDTFWGRFAAGLFLTVFGSFFCGLTLIRLQRHWCSAGTFVQSHVPEQDMSLLQSVSKAVMGSTIFGILYEGLGARFLHHDLHPEYTVFHYITHLTITLLFCAAGCTGLLESLGKLPPDSMRCSVVVALFGEALLWQTHAGSKVNTIDALIHVYLAGLALLSALSMMISIFIGSGDGTSVLPFVAYVGGFLGLLWQGLWFFMAAFHQSHPISSTEQVTVYFCLQGLLLQCLVQGSIAVLTPTNLQNADLWQQQQQQQSQQLKSNQTSFSPLSEVDNEEENDNDGDKTTGNTCSMI